MGVYVTLDRGTYEQLLETRSQNYMCQVPYIITTITPRNIPTPIQVFELSVNVPENSREKYLARYGTVVDLVPLLKSRVLDTELFRKHATVSQFKVRNIECRQLDFCTSKT